VSISVCKVSKKNQRRNRLCAFVIFLFSLYKISLFFFNGLSHTTVITIIENEYIHAYTFIIFVMHWKSCMSVKNKGENKSRNIMFEIIAIEINYKGVCNLACYFDPLFKKIYFFLLCFFFSLLINCLSIF